MVKNMFVKSRILRSTHAFATRLGGVSQNDHTKELNLAFGRGDEDATVIKNLEIFAKSAGFDPESVVSLPQIHSNTIFTVGSQNRGQGYYKREGIDNGDGYVTADPFVTLGIKTADCVPILFEAEKDGRIIAVGAVHAGWRGTVANIAPKCVGMLCEKYSVEPKNIRAAIGPCIHSCCYEVSSDLYEAVENAFGKETADRFVLPSGKNDGKFFCDLAGLNRTLLESSGLSSESIDIIDECTCCCHDKYFSHRYTKGLRGTMLNIIRISD